MKVARGEVLLSLLEFRLLFGFLIQIIPCVYLCMFPFMEDEHIDRKQIKWLVRITIIIIGVVFIWLSIHTHVQSENDCLWFNGYFGFFYLCYFCIYLYIIDLELVKKIFVFFLVSNYAMVMMMMNSVFIKILLKFFGKFDHDLYEFVTLLCYAIVTAVTLPFMKAFLLKIKKFLFLTELKEIWNKLNIILIIYFGSNVLSYFFFNLSSEHNMLRLMMLYLISLILGEIFISYLMVLLFFSINHGIEQKNKVCIMEKNIQYQVQHYEKLRLINDNTRKIRHDIRKHSILLQDMLIQKEYKRAIEYLKEYNHSILKDYEIINYSHNYVINILLQYYANEAKNEGIVLECICRENNNLSIKDTDLCIIFGNCLENAIEACKKLPDEKRFIRVSTKIQHRAYVITIDNSFDGIVIKEDNKIHSRKQDGGIGIENICMITKRYEGVANFEVDNKIFKTSIILMLEPMESNSCPQEKIHSK